MELMYKDALKVITDENRMSDSELTGDMSSTAVRIQSARAGLNKRYYTSAGIHRLDDAVITEAATIYLQFNPLNFAQRGTRGGARSGAR